MPMPPNTPADFLKLLYASQLLAPSLYKQLVPKLSPHRDVLTSPRLLARVLISHHIITPYQAQQLLLGRYSDFYVGKFKLLDLLGRGGMGKVFLAEQITMHRLVAVKVLRARIRSNEEVHARFIREAHAVAALDHPNIVQAFDFDEIKGIPYIVMEYIEGLDLEALIKKVGSIPWNQAADIVRQTALGLQAAHDAGLVHRDIKPGNLMVTPVGRVKILDLGLVSCVEESEGQLTNEMNQLGTADYISPEQAINSHTVDIRSDIYSLGAVFYFLVTGRVLFPHQTTARKLLLHQQGDIVPVQSLNPDLPDEVADIIHRMLAKKPEDRPQEPIELTKYLETFSQPWKPSFDSKELTNVRKKMVNFLRRSPRNSTVRVAESLPSDSQVKLETGAQFANTVNRLNAAASSVRSQHGQQTGLPQLPAHTEAINNADPVIEGHSPDAGMDVLVPQRIPKETTLLQKVGSVLLFLLVSLLLIALGIMIGGVGSSLELF